MQSSSQLQLCYVVHARTSERVKMADNFNLMNPMSEFDEENIEVYDETIAEKYQFDPSLRGKWMLFYDIDYMDEKWKEAVTLYRAGELTGIVSIKTSTAAECARASETDRGTIRFACGPSDDEGLILQYGLNLIKKMKHFSSYGFVAYKTDDQSRVGTKATGAVKNYTYRLPVSTHDHLKKRSSVSSEYPIDVPSRTWDLHWLSEALHSKVTEQVTTPVEYGKVARWQMMFLKGTPHDSAWVNACRYYRSGKLDGVLYLSSSTAKALPGHENRPEGIIYFYCDPNESASRLKEVGVNLVRLFNYSNKFNSLRCTARGFGGSGFIELCRVPLK